MVTKLRLACTVSEHVLCNCAFFSGTEVIYYKVMVENKISNRQQLQSFPNCE